MPITTLSNTFLYFLNMIFIKSLLLYSLFALLFMGQSTQNTDLLDTRDSNPEVSLNSDTEPTRLDSIKLEVESLTRQNRLSEAYELSHEGLKLAQEQNDNSGIFDFYLHLAGQFLDRNIPDSTVYYSEEARQLAENDEQLQQALNSLGNGHAKAGRSILAIDLYQQVLQIADSLGNEKYSVGVLINLATAHSSQGDLNKGLEYYFEALERSEDLENQEFIALITNNLGDKYNESENYGQAEYFLNRSKKISEEEGLTSNLLRALLNLGNTYMATDRFDEAEESYTRVLEMHEQSGNLTGEIQVIYNLGKLNLARQEYTGAREYLEQALQRSEEANILPGVYYSTNGLGDLELELGNSGQAIQRYERGVAITEETGNRSMKHTAYENMYNAHKKAGNSAEALAWLEEANDLQEEMRTAESERLTAQFETKFELRRSEQEKQMAELQQQQQQTLLTQQRWIIVTAFAGIIILLVAGVVLIRSNQKRKSANLKLIESNRQLKKLNKTVQDQKEELERLNNVKTKMFAIIAHDLRGPLGSLQSLLYLLREHDLSEQETNELTANLEKNMLENSSMMDNLLGWAQSQMNGLSINKRSFDLHLAVQSVLDQFKLQLESKKIDMNLEIPEETKIHADYDLMKLVIRNLIANAIKFSNPNSTITLRAEKNNQGEYRIAVADQGVGIPEEHRSKIFSDVHFTSTGTNKEKGSGLGLNLCKEYVEKHGGSIWFETELNNGTTFYFTVDAAEEEELVNA